MSNLINLSFENQSVTTAIDGNGEILFRASELATALGFGNPRQAISTHVDNDDIQKLEIVCDVQELDGTSNKARKTQKVNFVNESGMYALIFGSTKDEAKRFKRWVTSEVLPSIRKTGTYRQQTKPTNQLTDTNWKNLKRLVWLCENNFKMQKSAGHAIWARLRAVAGVKSPEKFSTHHLPILAVELERIFRLSEQYSRAVQATEQLIIRNVLKYADDEPMEFFLAEMAQKATDYHQAKTERLPAFFGQDCQNLISRL